MTIKWICNCLKNVQTANKNLLITVKGDTVTEWVPKIWALYSVFLLIFMKRYKVHLSNLQMNMFRWGKEYIRRKTIKNDLDSL